MAAWKIGLSAISAIASAGMQIQQGRAQAAALEFEARQIDEQKKLARLQAEQQINERQRELRSIMGANKAISAGSGIDVFAGSAGSLLLADLSKARRDTRYIDINRSNQLRQLSRASGQRRLSASVARRSGLTRAAGTLFGEFSNMDKYGNLFDG